MYSASQLFDVLNPLHILISASELHACPMYQDNYTDICIRPTQLLDLVFATELDAGQHSKNAKGMHEIGLFLMLLLH